MSRASPLQNLSVVEFDAIGPTPFCGMMLADHGARITRIVRPGGQPNGINVGEKDILLRNRAKEIPIDLKSDAGRKAALGLIETADVLLEGHRPGVMERLGLGPEACHALNPRLVYCRITGYGQTGPLANHPGHDINYIAQTGALYAMGMADRPPPPPLSLIGDFGGGGMLGAFGVLAAVFAARESGKGSVVDVAMVDGAALLMAMTYGWANAGQWSAERCQNILDGAAPFYRCYKTKDDKFIAVGAIEPKFYAAMCVALGLSDPIFQDQMNQENWPEMSRRIEEIVGAKSMKDLKPALADPSACISEVLSMNQAAETGHAKARGTLKRQDGVIDVAPAPRIQMNDEAN